MRIKIVCELALYAGVGLIFGWLAAVAFFGFMVLISLLSRV